MAHPTEGSTSWLDDLKDLILKKKEENAALRKIQESLQSQGVKNETAGQDNVDETSASEQEIKITQNTQNKNT